MEFITKNQAQISELKGLTNLVFSDKNTFEATDKECSYLSVG